MLETKSRTNALLTNLTIRVNQTNITTLFHVLVCLVTKNYDIIIDMLRFPRMRQTSFETFESMQASQDCKRYGIYVPSTPNFILELALFAQDSSIVTQFREALIKALHKNSTNFKKEAKEWINKSTKYETYVKRILKQYNTLF